MSEIVTVKDAIEMMINEAGLRCEVLIEDGDGLVHEISGVRCEAGQLIISYMGASKYGPN